MIYDVSKLNATKIVIGRRGENLATSIEIDVSAWLTEFPSASLQVVVMRPGDTAPYVAGTSVSDGVLTWPITNVDTENAGKGKIEVRASSGDVMKKSVIATIEIEPCILCDENAEPPELDPALVEQAIAAATRAENAVQEAKNVLADGMSWDEMTGKPEEFPPADHDHTWYEIARKPDAYPPEDHSHAWKEITNRPSAFPPTSHSHNVSDISGLNAELSKRDRALNLLDNSDFTAGRLINQRGITVSTQFGAHIVDRWITEIANDGATVSVDNGGITFRPQSGNYTSLYQKFERYDQMQGKTYTFAVCVGDVWECAVFQMGDLGGGSLFNNGLRFYSVEFAHVLLRSYDRVVTVQRVALYEGAYTADTLPEYQYKGYAAELAECQRYYREFYRVFGQYVGGVSREAIVINPPMRVPPTVTVKAQWQGTETSGVTHTAVDRDFLDAEYEGYGNVRFALSADL